MPEITFADLGNKHRECHCVISNHKSKTSEASNPENCLNSKYGYESERANPISKFLHVLEEDTISLMIFSFNSR